MDIIKLHLDLYKNLKHRKRVYESVTYYLCYFIPMAAFMQYTGYKKEKDQYLFNIGWIFASLNQYDME